LTGVPHLKARSSRHWFYRGVIAGLFAVVTINALSYSIRNESMLDMTSNRDGVSESFGWPYIVSSEDYMAAGWGFNIVDIETNVVVWICLVIFCGILGVVFGNQFNRRIGRMQPRDENKRNVRHPGVAFHFSIMNLILLTSLASASIYFAFYWGAIQRTQVSSEVIKSVGHSSITNTLEIEFNDDRIYQYFHVPRSKYERLLKTTSPDLYFSKIIGNKYVYALSPTEINGVIMTIWFLGPLWMFLLASIPSGVRFRVRCAIILATGIGLFAVSIVPFLRVGYSVDRIVFGMFVFWVPQIAIFVLGTFFVWLRNGRLEPAVV